MPGLALRDTRERVDLEAVLDRSLLRVERALVAIDDSFEMCEGKTREQDARMRGTESRWVVVNAISRMTSVRNTKYRGKMARLFFWRHLDNDEDECCNLGSGEQEKDGSVDVGTAKSRPRSLTPT